MRIIVLEWQTRPANRLLMNDAYDDYQEYFNTLGINGLASSVFKPESSFVVRQSIPKDKDAKLFDDVKGRHQRLLHIYLSERQYLIRTCEYIIFGTLFEIYPHQSDEIRDQSKDISLEMPEWLAGVGDQILVAWNLDGIAQNSDKHFTVDAVNALRLRCQALRSGSGWFGDEPDFEQIDQAWGKNQFLEIIHIMRLLFTLILSSTKMSRSDTLLAWFRLMDEYGFLNNLNLVG